MISEAHLTAFARETYDKIIERGYWDDIPEFLDALVRAVAQAQRDLDAPYMQHKKDCWIRKEQLIDRDSGPVIDTNFGCSCGLDDLREQPK